MAPTKKRSSRRLKPPAASRPQVNFIATPALLKRLDACAEMLDSTRSRVARLACEAYSEALAERSAAQSARGLGPAVQEGVP